jgi:hypothetical protein
MVDQGAVVIDTLADILGRYTRRPEDKSHDPHGQPGTGQTHGELQRRPVVAHPASTLLTGKESNKLAERLTGEITNIGDYRNDHGTRTDLWQLVVAVLQDVGSGPLIAAGIPRATAYTVLQGSRTRKHQQTCLDVACQHAAAALTERGIDPPAATPLLLAAYLAQRDIGARRCQWCGKPLRPNARADARYDTDNCRRAAHRAMTRPQTGRSPDSR